MSINELEELEGNKLKFNIIYYRTFQNTLTILEELQIHLKEHLKVFPSVPIADFYSCF